MEEIELFDIIKILHIVAVISWMVGLLYLPRIFVYHTQVEKNSQTDKIFQTMELRLIKFIMNPAMIIAIFLGFYLASEIGFDSGGWLHLKIFLVFCLAAYHGFLSRCRKNFASGKNIRSEKFYRLINEIPTFAMIIIISLVVLKPF
jgi:putative membrane protein